LHGPSLGYLGGKDLTVALEEPSKNEGHIVLQPSRRKTNQAHEAIGGPLEIILPSGTLYLGSFRVTEEAIRGDENDSGRTGVSKRDRDRVARTQERLSPIARGQLQTTMVLEQPGLGVAHARTRDSASLKGYQDPGCFVSTRSEKRLIRLVEQELWFPDALAFGRPLG
jgi:hypothetical protein